MNIEQTTGEHMNIQAATWDDEMLERATEKFTEITGVPIRVAAYEPQIGTGRHVDALIYVDEGGATNAYAVEIKRYLTGAKLGLAAEQLKGAPYKGMLVADYVNPNMADRLREMDLAFIDLVGNAYLNEPPVFVFVKGNKPPDKKQLGPTRKPTRAFNPTGLKMLFGLLTKPELLQQTYREIADETDVALGTVGWVLTDLRDHSLLFEAKGRERRLTQRRRIVEHWVAAYPEKLRPKLLLGRYTAPQHRWWTDVELDPQTAQWGGEVAAEILTDYLNPENVVIYADAVPAKLIVEHRLQIDPEGEVEILQRFWKPELLNTNFRHPTVPINVVPPLLIYADLMATADERNIETARMIYDKFLYGYFE